MNALRSVSGISFLGSGSEGRANTFPLLLFLPARLLWLADVNSVSTPIGSAAASDLT